MCLKKRVDLSTGIAGQAGSTTNLISDPALATEEKRFYRAILTGGASSL
ncbi:hypothetical protein [Pontiella sulfatireligans]|nr:hypothetical protein [Pontiella sulfatireligans]